MLKYLFLSAFFLMSTSFSQSENSAKDDGAMILGKQEAPIVIENYSSLTCGHCAHFHETVLPKLKPYIDQGKVRYVFRHFPTDRRAVEAVAIVLTLPVLKRSKAVELLFKQQTEWVTAEHGGPAFAKVLSMKPEVCEKIIKDKASIEAALKVRLDVEKNHKIEATPYFIFNNGRVINYAPSWQELEEKYLKSSQP